MIRILMYLLSQQVNTDLLRLGLDRKTRVTGKCVQTSSGYKLTC